MLYEVVATAIGVAGLIVGGGCVHYGRQQYLLALKVSQRSNAHLQEVIQGKATDNSTPLQYLVLGQFLWFLCNPPRLTTTVQIFGTINRFLEELDKCGLSDTRATAKPLETIRLECRSAKGLITPDAQSVLMDAMAIVRACLENEVGRRG